MDQEQSATWHGTTILSVRKGGKIDKRNLYHALLWLWGKSPATLIANLELVGRHTCWGVMLDAFMYCFYQLLREKFYF